jgi:hypothetical protein
LLGEKLAFNVEVTTLRFPSCIESFTLQPNDALINTFGYAYAA